MAKHVGGGGFKPHSTIQQPFHKSRQRHKPLWHIVDGLDKKYSGSVANKKVQSTAVQSTFLAPVPPENSRTQASKIDMCSHEMSIHFITEAEYKSTYGSSAY